MKIRWFIIGALTAAVLQTGALAKIVYDRAQLLQNGTEVVLQSGMVDPRDLFRGHYVTLNLMIGRIPAKNVTLTGKPKGGQDVWVSLKKGEGEFWVPDTLYAEFPGNSDKPVIKGEYRLYQNFGATTDEENLDTITHVIRFPINRFFAEKERALDLEKVRNDRNLGVVVALADDGTAAIKGISVEGELIYVESVW